MKKASLLFALLLIITACSTKKEIPSNLDQLKPIDAKGESYLIGYTFNKGEELTYKLTTINQATENIKSDSVSNTNIDETANYTIALSAIDVDKDTVTEFNVNVAAIDLVSKVNGKEMKYNSVNKMTNDEKVPFIQYEAIVNNPFRMRVNKKGEVVEVTRVDKIVDKILTLQPSPQPLSIDEKASLNKNLTERAIQPLVQQLFRLMPAKKLAVDSTWSYAYPNVVGQLQIINQVIFKFKNVLDGGDKIAFIEADMKTSLMGNKSMSDGKITAVFDDPVIKGGGKVYFNIDKGHLLKSETFTDQDFRVVLTNKELGNKKVDRNQKSKNKLIVELVK